MTLHPVSLASFPSDVTTAAVPSGPVNLSGALAAFPSAVPMSAPDILSISLGLAALVLALVAIVMAASLGRVARAEEAEEYTIQPAHRPPTHIFSGSSLEDDEDQG